MPDRSIGVNSAICGTFKSTWKTAIRLAEQIPANVVRVAESGIHTPADVARLRAAEYHAFLVGESLMRTPHPGEALQELLNAVPSPK